MLLTFNGCVQNREGPTGFRAGPSYPGDDYVVETCKEEDFYGKWWSFDTDNILANTLVPTYKDYCTYVDENYVFFWNSAEQYGYYNGDFYWKCANENTMYIINEDTGDQIDVRIYGKVSAECYDIKITYGANVINGDLCSCEYDGP